MIYPPFLRWIAAALSMPPLITWSLLTASMGKVLLLWVVLSVLVAFLGINRRLGFWGYFLGSLLLTPLVGLLLVFASSPQKKQ